MIDYFKTRPTQAGLAMGSLVGLYLLLGLRQFIIAAAIFTVWAVVWTWSGRKLRGVT